MDYEYILVCEIVGGKKWQHGPFHQPTPEEAETTARQLFIDELKKIVVEFPFAPPSVKGTLYRGFKDFDSATYVSATHVHPVPVWKCADLTCNHVGKESDFSTPNEHCCPKCGSEDVFPCRAYKCKKCGKVGTEEEWFPEWHCDDNPLEESVEAQPCHGCVKKFKQEQIGVTEDRNLDNYWDQLHELEQAPADLEEVPVELAAIPLPTSD